MAAFRKPTSLSVRLTLLFTAATFVLLASSAGVTYGVLSRTLHRQASLFLSDKIDVLKTILKERPGDHEALQEEIQWETASRRHERYFSRVTDGEGRVILETPGMSGALSGAPFPAPAAIGQEWKGGLLWGAGGERYYLLGSALAEEGGSGGRHLILQAAVDLSREEDILEDYRHAVAVALLVDAVFSVLLGIAAARRGLRPLKAMAGKAHQITAERLHERMGGQPWPAELAELAAAFDDMLLRLEESFSRLSAFSADLAHDLRTPLTNCMGEVEVALSRPRSAQEYRAVLESSLEELTRLSRMIESLLFLARADNAREPLAKAGLDLGREIRAMTELYEAVAQEQGVALSCSGAGSLDADPALLRRALGNLLSNAIRHTPSGGTVRLEAHEEEGASVIAVRDSGPGIPAEDLPRVFDRFYRSPRSRASHPQGLGLGLAIVKSIMDLHGGSVEILRAPGGGALVRLTFPAAGRSSNGHVERA